MNSKDGFFKTQECIKSCNCIYGSGKVKGRRTLFSWKAIFRMKPGVVVICKWERNKNLKPNVRTRYSQEGDCKLWNGTWDLTLLTGAVQHQVSKSWILKALLFAVSVLVLRSWWWPHLNCNVQGHWDMTTDNFLNWLNRVRTQCSVKHIWIA